MNDAAVAGHSGGFHRPNPLGEDRSPSSSIGSVTGAAANDGAAAGSERPISVEAKAAIEYGEGYRVILESMGEPGYGAMKALFYGEEGPPPSTIPAISVSFELFESVQTRFVNTELVLERTRAELHTRCQELNETNARYEQLQASYDVLEKRSLELEKNNTQLHQSIARQNISADQLRQQISRLKAELGMFEDRMAKRDEELQISNNRVAEGLVALSLKETIITNLRRQIGMASYGRRLPHQQLMHEGGEYSAEALKIIAEGVEGNSVEAEHRLYTLGLESEIRKLEDEKKYIMMRHTLYRKHVQEVTEAYETLCMAKEDAVLSHVCVGPPAEGTQEETESVPTTGDGRSTKFDSTQDRLSLGRASPKSADGATLQGAPTSVVPAQLVARRDVFTDDEGSVERTPLIASHSTLSDSEEDVPSAEEAVPKTKSKKKSNVLPPSVTSGRDSRASVSWDKLATSVDDAALPPSSKGRQSGAAQPPKTKGDLFSPLGLPRPDTGSTSSPRQSLTTRTTEKSKKKSTSKRPAKEATASKSGAAGHSSERAASDLSFLPSDNTDARVPSAGSDSTRRGAHGESRTEKQSRRDDASQRPFSGGSTRSSDTGRRRVTSASKRSLTTAEDADIRERRKTPSERRTASHSQTSRGGTATTRDLSSHALPPLGVGRGSSAGAGGEATTDDGERENSQETRSLSQTMELMARMSPLSVSVGNHVAELARHYGLLHQSVIALNELLESLSLRGSTDSTKTVKFRAPGPNTNTVVLTEHMSEVVLSDTLVLENFLRHVRGRLPSGGSASDTTGERSSLSSSNNLAPGSPRGGAAPKFPSKGTGASQGLRAPGRADDTGSPQAKGAQQARKVRAVAAASPVTSAGGGSTRSAASPSNQKASPVRGSGGQQQPATGGDGDVRTTAKPASRHGPGQVRGRESSGDVSSDERYQQGGKTDLPAQVQPQSPRGRKVSSQLSRSGGGRSSPKSFQSHDSGSLADSKRRWSKGGTAHPIKPSHGTVGGGSSVFSSSAVEKVDTPPDTAPRPTAVPAKRSAPGSLRGPITDAPQFGPGTSDLPCSDDRDTKVSESTGGATFVPFLSEASGYVRERSPPPVTLTRRGVQRIPWRASVIRVDLLTDIPEVKQRDRAPPARFTGLQQNFSFIQQRGTPWYDPGTPLLEGDEDQYEPREQRLLHAYTFTPRTAEQIFAGIGRGRERGSVGAGGTGYSERAGPGSVGYGPATGRDARTVPGSFGYGPATGRDARTVPSSFGYGYGAGGSGGGGPGTGFAHRGAYKPLPLQRKLARTHELPQRKLKPGVTLDIGTEGFPTARTYLRPAEEAYYRSLSRMLLAHRPKSATGPVLPESPVLEPNMFKCFNPISTMSSVQSNPVVRPRPYVNMGAEGSHSNDISRRRGTSALRPVGRNLKMCSPLPCVNITLGDVGVDENLWQESGLPQSWRPLSSTAKCVQRSLLRNVNRLCQSTLGRRPSNLAFCRNVVKRYVQKVQSCDSGDFSPPRLSGALIRKQILRYSANRARTLRHSAKRLPRRAFFVKQCILARRGAELCSNWVLVPLELRHLGGRHPPSVSPNSSFRMSP